MVREIDNSMDVIDSRDFIERMEELQEERDSLQEAIDEAVKEVDECTEETDREELNEVVKEARQALADWDEENGKDLEAMKACAEEAEGYCSDWTHGEALIRESYFQEYAEQLANDIGAIDSRKNYGWPLDHIDWEAAANALKIDYTEVDFGGVTYLIRS